MQPIAASNRYSLAFTIAILFAVCTQLLIVADAINAVTSTSAGSSVSSLPLIARSKLHEIKSDVWTSVETVLYSSATESWAASNERSDQDREFSKQVRAALSNSAIPISDVVLVSKQGNRYLQSVAQFDFSSIPSPGEAARLPEGRISTASITCGTHPCQVFWRPFSGHQLAAVVDYKALQTVLPKWIRIQSVQEDRGTVDQQESIELEGKEVFPGAVFRFSTDGIQGIRQNTQLRIRILKGLAFCSLAAILFAITIVFRMSRTIQQSKERNTFTSCISHDLRTPVSLIRLYADTLLSVKNLTPAERDRCAAIISRETFRLHILNERLITFSRIQRGQEQHHLDREDLQATVREAVESYRDSLLDDEFTLAVDLPKRLPRVLHDSVAVTEAVVNLLENAVKYSNERKSIAVSMEQSNGDVVVEVADRGIGIPQDLQERIFDKFFRGHSELSTGEGLGLFIVKRTLEKHQGRVELHSKEGQGSRFRLCFPIIANPTTKRRFRFQP